MPKPEKTTAYEFIFNLIINPKTVIKIIRVHLIHREPMPMPTIVVGDQGGALGSIFVAGFLNSPTNIVEMLYALHFVFQCPKPLP